MTEDWRRSARRIVVRLPQPQRAELWAQYQHDADAFHVVNSKVGEVAPTIRWFAEREAFGRLLFNIIRWSGLANSDQHTQQQQKRKRKDRKPCQKQQMMLL